MPELFVVPQSPDAKGKVGAALTNKVQSMQATWPGVAIAEQGLRFHITIPQHYRIGHEAHFAEVAKIMRPRRRRQLTAQQKKDLAARLRTC